MKAIKLIALAVFCLGLGAEPAGAEQPLRVVATLSTFADITQRIGGDLVEVRSVAPPAFDPHFIEPKPSDVLRAKRADLFIHAGLDLEAWRDPLLNAVGNAELRPGGKRSLDLSRDIQLLNVPHGAPSRAEGDVHLYGNPHYWLNPENGLKIARTIAAKLSELSPENAGVFEANYQRFSARLRETIEGWRSKLEPLKGREMVVYHDSWPYLAEFAGVKVAGFIEPKPGIPPTARHMLELERMMRDRGVRLLAQETFYPENAAESLSRKTSAKTAKLCQNVGEIEQCGDYIALIDYNLGTIYEGLS